MRKISRGGLQRAEEGQNGIFEFQKLTEFTERVSEGDVGLLNNPNSQFR
jgi:hypothetical protein